MAQYELNLRDYLRIFHKRRFTIIGACIVAVIASILYLSPQPSVYKASATLKIQERKTIAGLLTELVLYSPADTMESETKFIKSYPVLKEAAFRMGMILRDSTPEQISAALIRCEEAIETEKVGATNMIRVTATMPSAAYARDLANTVAEVYIAQNLMEKAKQVRHAREFIEEQLNVLEKRLMVSEEKLRRFSDDVKNIKMAEPIHKKLADLEFEAVELLQKYTDKHPRVTAIREQIKTLENQVHGFSGQELEYSRLSREVEVNKRLYGLLKEKLEEARISEAQKVADVSIVNPAVLPARPVSTNKRLGILMGALIGIVLGCTLAFVLETLDTSISTIEDVESVVKLPVLGAIPSIESEAGSSRGFMICMRDRFKPHTKTECESRVTSLIVHYKPQSSSSEAYRNIYTNLKLDAAHKTIMITSAGPQEGKSTVAGNLALVAAQAGLKTLIVSADLRRPVMARAFGIDRAPGLHEAVMGTVSVDAALRNITDIVLGELSFDEIRLTSGIDNVWVLPTGEIPHNPAEILESKKMLDIVSELRSRFDIVFFDVPPVLPVTDASILAHKMDSVIIVHEIGRTSKEALVRAKVQLESVGARVAGVVLNHIRPQIESALRYPYYYRYKYRYYSSEVPSKKNKKTYVSEKDNAPTLTSSV